MSRILVLNDSQLESQIMKDVLTTVGHEVKVVTKARESFDALERFKPHLMILDIVLDEGFTGIDLAKKFKALPQFRDLPLIFMSGSSSKQDLVMALRSGGTDFIYKPFHNEELLARIDVALRQKSMLDWLRVREEALKVESMIDFLTNLPNRQYLTNRLQEEISRVNRYKSPTFCFIMADIDKFKQVNDTYGHLAGDQILTYVANLFQSRLRTSDTAFRFGGEEFCILGPETDLEGGYTMAESLRQALAEQTITVTVNHRTFDLNVTCSFGVAEFAKSIDTAESLIARADEALYRAKQNGRNRVERED